MSLSESTDRSPLIGQPDRVLSVPVEGKPHEDGESGAIPPLPSPDEPPSNLMLALIMGSVWVRYAGIIRLQA